MSNSNASDDAKPPSDSGEVFYHEDKHIGMTMMETTVEQLQDGTWLAVRPIGSLFGAPVEGSCKGTGQTREEALESLKRNIDQLHDSLWA